jgi:hypothetical protein
MTLGETAREVEPGEPLAVSVIEDHAAVRLGVEAILRRTLHTIAGGTEVVTSAH